MLKAIAIGLLFAAFIAGCAFVLYVLIRQVIDCLPDPDDEEE